MEKQSSGRRITELNRQELRESHRITVHETPADKLHQKSQAENIGTYLLESLRRREAVMGGVIFSASFLLMLGFQFGSQYFSSPETSEVPSPSVKTQKPSREINSNTTPMVKVHIDHLPMKTVLDQFALRFGLNVVWHDMPRGVINVVDGKKRTPGQVYQLLQSLCRQNGFELAHQGRTLHVARIGNTISLTSFYQSGESAAEPNALPEFAPLPKELVEAEVGNEEAPEIEQQLEQKEQLQQNESVSTETIDNSTEPADGLKTLFEIEEESDEDVNAAAANSSTDDILGDNVFEIEDVEMASEDIGEIDNEQTQAAVENRAQVKQSENENAAQQAQIDSEKPRQTESNVARNNPMESSDSETNAPKPNDTNESKDEVSSAIDTGEKPVEKSIPAKTVSASPEGIAAESQTTPVNKLNLETETINNAGTISQGTPDSGFVFDYENSDWKTVLSELAKMQGLTLQFRSLPPGKLTTRQDRQFTFVEALDFLNQSLIQTDHLLVRNSQTMAVIRLSRGVPSEFVATTTANKIDSYGQFEMLSIAIPANAERTSLLASQIRALLGSEGRVKELPSHSYVLVRDFAGNLRPLQNMVVRKSGKVVRLRQAKQFVLRNASVLTAFERVEQLQQEWASIDQNAGLIAPVHVVAEVFTNTLRVLADEHRMQQITAMIESLEAESEVVTIQAMILEVDTTQLGNLQAERGFHDSVLFKMSFEGLSDSLPSMAMSKVNGALAYGGLVIAGENSIADAVKSKLSAAFHTSVLGRPTIRTHAGKSASIGIGAKESGELIDIEVIPAVGPKGQIILESSIHFLNGETNSSLTATASLNPRESLALGGIRRNVANGGTRELLVVLTPATSHMNADAMIGTAVSPGIPAKSQDDKIADAPAIPENPKADDIPKNRAQADQISSDIVKPTVDVASPQTIQIYPVPEVKEIPIGVGSKEDKETEAQLSTKQEPESQPGILFEIAPESGSPATESRSINSSTRIRGGLQNLEAQMETSEPFFFDDVEESSTSSKAIPTQTVGLSRQVDSPMIDTPNDPGSAAAVYGAKADFVPPRRLDEPMTRPRFPTPVLEPQVPPTQSIKKSSSERFRFLRTSRKTGASIQTQTESKSSYRDANGFESRVKRFFLIPE